MNHSIATHNGTVTITSPTGEHRTFRIRTQKLTDRFQPGKRIVALLSGSDNEHSYTPFGFVGENGQVYVWVKKRGTAEPSIWERYAWMLQDPATYEAKGAGYLFATQCRQCNRKLTTPTSIRNGIGPVCLTR